ncbi:MAG: phosphatidate cytidylyltransferase [Methylococcaceae bacterium]|nr:MAG: phosphatidate cytidylyltransferase [Methylococcaceae bacterium]
MQISKKNSNNSVVDADSKPDLTHRVLTATLVAGIIIPAVWWLPTLWFATVFGGIAALAAWEWAGLSALESKAGRWLYCGAFLLSMVSYHYWLAYLFDWFMWPVLAWWVGLAIALRQFPQKLLQLKLPVAAKLLMGYFVLMSAWIMFVWLHVNFGAQQVLYLLVLVAVADMAAYFAGKRWGFTKLLPEISPGKTVEGLYGALGGALLLALLVGGYFYGFANRWDGMVFGDFVLLSLMTVLVSVCGDMFESLLKRQRGVKDSGTWLPGHGGVLDRIDSLLAAVPFFYAGCALREIFFR